MTAESINLRANVGIDRMGICYAVDHKRRCLVAMSLGEEIGSFPHKAFEEAINVAEAENMMTYWRMHMEDEAWMRLRAAAMP